MGEERNRGRLYTYRYTVTTDQNDSCIKMGSDENKNHNRMGQCHQCPQSTLNLSEEKGEPKRNRAEVLLLTSVMLVHRICAAETAAVSRGTSHGTTKERYQYTASVDITNTCYKNEF